MAECDGEPRGGVVSRREVLGGLAAAAVIGGCAGTQPPLQQSQSPPVTPGGAGRAPATPAAEGAAGPASGAGGATFFNPLLPDGPDPWMVHHAGFYYFTRTYGRQIRVRKARSIADIWSARDIVVWEDRTPARGHEMWAPEFYLLDGPGGRRRWYLYYCASDGWHLNHRCHVLESTGETPLGPYAYRGQLRTDEDDKLYAIDAGVLVPGDGRTHILWAGHPGHRLFISDTENPWTTRGKRVLLRAQGFGCEEVREGPVTLIRNGKAFLIYSACDTGKPDYKLGMLIADLKSDLLRPQSWEQYPEPVFSRCDEHGVYGPGHNGFFTSPDGSEDWIIYHAKSTPAYTYRTRSPRAQRFTWRADGLPDFGKPLPLSAVMPVPSGDPGPSERPRTAPGATRPVSQPESEGGG